MIKLNTNQTCIHGIDAQDHCPKCNNFYKPYICPHCRTKQQSVISWQTISEAEEINIETGNVEVIDKTSGEFESFNCPSCGKEIEQTLFLK